jgi:hypothetical protein
MTTLHRRLGCIAMVLVIGGCGQAGETGQADATASPSVTASPTGGESSVAPSPLVRPLRDPDVDPGVPEILEPGTYLLDRFQVDLAFDIPEGDPPGWHAGKSMAHTAIVLWYTPPEITYGFAFWNVDNVHVDPCSVAAGELEPPIGPSVDDLVAALSTLPGLQATAPVDVTVGAFRGKEIELTTLDFGDDCPQVIAFSAGDGAVDLDLVNPLAGETFRVKILDVNGVRIVLYTMEPATRDAAVEAERQQILDSIRIESLP